MNKIVHVGGALWGTVWPVQARTEAKHMWNNEDYDYDADDNLGNMLLMVTQGEQKVGNQYTSKTIFSFKWFCKCTKWKK